MSTHLPKLSAGRVILAIAAVAVVYLLVSAAARGIRAHQLRQEEGQLRAETDDLQKRYERLLALEDYLNSDEYIEAVAREQLGLVRQGETGFVAISTVPTPSPAPGESHPELWWDVLIR